MIQHFKNGGKVDNPEIVDNISPASYKAEISTIDNDPPPAESSEGSQSRFKTLDASESFVPLRMERERLSDFSLEQRKYLSRGSDDDSYKFSRERYHGKTMRSPRLNFMPDRRRFSDNTESNLQDRDTKNFESNNYGNIRRGGGFMSSSYRGRRSANDEASPFPHSFTRRSHGFKEDASAFHGFRDGEKFTRGVQSNDTEPMFMNQPRPYQDQEKDQLVRLRLLGTDHRKILMGIQSFLIGGHPQRHNSPPPYSHGPSNAGRGEVMQEGEGMQGERLWKRWYRFRKPYDRVVHRNWNNVDPRERVDYSDDFFEGPIHSERFGGDGNVERRQFGYRHDGASSFRQSYSSDGCALTNIEDGSDDVRYGQNPDIEMVKEQGIDGKDKTSTENASGRSKNMEEEETSKYSEIWQRDELGGDGF
ncbi:hypothetical protein Bca52824_096084 [Brassica carinata]|uniref:Uncharacterized protein n=1 Tax=Brassica carinata TaxID=52824 RepID=A0A8X7NZ11_BRACI|nr:hypothetical protein Bca52824_096084 [Brassica carinata]